MTFEELGSLLQAERERRGIDVAAVAERLRISARIIRALESGDASGMPHAVYVRGFIRSYGSFLGIDSEELNPIINDLYPDEDSGVYNPPLGEEEHEPADGSGRIFVYLAILVCCAGAGVFWAYYGGDMVADFGKNIVSAGDPASAARPAPAAPKPNADKKAESGGRSAAGQAQAEKAPEGRGPTPPISVKQAEARQNAQPGAEQGAQPGRSVAAAQPDASAARSPGQTAPAPRQTEAAPAARQAESAAQPAGRHQIIITAQSECWLHSNADNADTRQFSLRKGDTFVLTFANRLVLKLGSAGSVRIRYDGQDMPPAGAVGQVRTLVFPPEQ